MPPSRERALTRHVTRETEAMRLRNNACEECGYKGPRRHYNWAHIVPVRKRNRTGRSQTASNATWWAYVRNCRLLCLLCHADETEMQRARKWSAP